MLRALLRLLHSTGLRAAAAVPCLACAATDVPAVVEEQRLRNRSPRVVENSLHVVRPDPAITDHLQIVLPDPARCFHLQIVAAGEVRPKAR